MVQQETWSKCEHCKKEVAKFCSAFCAKCEKELGTHVLGVSNETIDACARRDSENRTFTIRPAWDAEQVAFYKTQCQAYCAQFGRAWAAAALA